MLTSIITSKQNKTPNYTQCVDWTFSFKEAWLGASTALYSVRSNVQEQAVLHYFQKTRKTIKRMCPVLWWLLSKVLKAPLDAWAVQPEEKDALIFPASSAWKEVTTLILSHTVFILSKYLFQSKKKKNQRYPSILSRSERCGGRFFYERKNVQLDSPRIRIPLLQHTCWTEVSLRPLAPCLWNMVQVAATNFCFSRPSLISKTLCQRLPEKLPSHKLFERQNEECLLFKKSTCIKPT